MKILRTKCDFDWVTPFGALRTLPINCASDSSENWPYQYRWTKTVETTNPISTTELVSDTDPYFHEQGQSSSGQIILRAFFAYVATDDWIIEAELKAYPDVPWSDGDRSENVSLTAKLYDATTNLVESYLDTSNREGSTNLTLPATICPKVVWLNASIQPTGTPPPGQTGLPPCYAEITLTP